MLFDGGVCTVFELVEEDGPGIGPVYKLREKERRCFGELTVGYGRYYEAQRENQHIDRSIRVWEDRSVQTTDICEIAGVRYRVRQVQQRTDDDGLKVTDLALERTSDDVILSAEVKAE